MFMDMPCKQQGRLIDCMNFGHQALLLDLNGLDASGSTVIVDVGVSWNPGMWTAHWPQPQLLVSLQIAYDAICETRFPTNVLSGAHGYLLACLLGS